MLTALLSREEVSWDGKYYQFEPLTIQPRPMRDIPIMMACATPKSTYHSARRGFHIQTTPLAGDREHVLNLVDAFQRGRAECGERGAELTLTMSRIGLIVHDERRRKAREELAQHYYSQFDNVFTGPGRVSHGFIEPLPREQTTEQLAANLLICTPGEMVDRVAPYAEEGVDRFVLNPNFGASQSEMLETLQCFAEEVMPHFADRDAAAGAKAGAAE